MGLCDIKYIGGICKLPGALSDLWNSNRSSNTGVGCGEWTTGGDYEDKCTNPEPVVPRETGISADPSNVNEFQLLSGVEITWRPDTPISNCDGSTRDLAVTCGFPEPFGETSFAEDANGEIIPSLTINQKYNSAPTCWVSSYYNPNEKKTVQLTRAEALEKNLKFLTYWPTVTTESAEDTCAQWPNPAFVTQSLSVPASEIFAGENYLFSYARQYIKFCDGTNAAEKDPGNGYDLWFSVSGGEYNQLDHIIANTDTEYFYKNLYFNQMYPVNYTVTMFVRDLTFGGENSISTVPFSIANTASAGPLATILAPFAGEVGEMLTLTTPSPDENTYSYSWELISGDPEIEGSLINYSFENPGTYMIRLTIARLDNPGISNSNTQNITIVPIGVDIPALGMNNPPYAAEMDANFTLAVANPDTANWDYSWNVGSGSPLTGATITHSYASTGPKTIVLTATSKANPQYSFSINHSITIIPHGSPVPNIIITPGMGPSPLNVVLDATNSRATAAGATITNYSVIWGDNGSVAEENTGGIFNHSFTCVNNSSCGYNVQTTVEDSNGATSAITVAVATWPPPANP